MDGPAHLLYGASDLPGQIGAERVRCANMDNQPLAEEGSLARPRMIKQLIRDDDRAGRVIFAQ